MINKPIRSIDAFLGGLISLLLRLVPHSTRRVRCLLIHEDQVLLVINRLSHIGQVWTLPGGGIKSRESVEAAGAREIHEELAIELDPSTLIHLGQYNYRHGLGLEVLEVLVATVSDATYIRQRLELLDARWFKLTELPEDQHPIVGDAIKALNSKT